MKKVLTTMVAVFLCFSLVACGQNEENNSKTNESSHNTTQVTSEKTTEKSHEGVENEYSEVVSIPMKSIFVNGHKDMRVKEVTYACMLYTDNESMTALAYDVMHPFHGSLEDVVGFLNDVVLKDINNNCEVPIRGCKIVAENSEKVTINGFDSIKFTGCIPSDGVKLHIRGYSFIINDVPCMVIGLVSDRDQNSELISSVDKHVDNMVKTIRTKE